MTDDSSRAPARRPSIQDLPGCRGKGVEEVKCSEARDGVHLLTTAVSNGEEIAADHSWWITKVDPSYLAS